MGENKTKPGTNLLFGILLIAIIFSVSNVSATFTVSNPQTSLYNSIFTPTTAGFNSAMCQQGQDFAIQISPTGCEPTVVRSDLLSQQDVPVFCPLAATQLNPLINVNAISSITFSGDYSKYVQSIGFYPAQAALNLNGQVNNYPLLSNVGYVVIDLKQIPNESAMPDFVSGNLTAKINYNAQNVLGIGTANLYLPVLDSSTWQSTYPDYGFWNGKGYLRAVSIQGNTATIAVYDSNLNQISSTALQVGQSTSSISIPGFDLCSGTAQLKLNSLQNANTRATLDVNGNIMEVAQGESFINNDCQVLSIQKQGVVDDVQIGCNTDSGKRTFDLRLSPRVTLDINGQNVNAGLGDYLYSDNNMAVYLGYIGDNGQSITGTDGYKNLQLVLVELPNQGPGTTLTNDQLASVAALMYDYGWQRVTGQGIADVIINAAKTFVGVGSQFLQSLVQGKHMEYLDSTTTVPTFGAQVSIVGFSSPQDAVLSNQQQVQNYQNAISDYQTVLSNYPTETYGSNSENLGEQALYQQMQLAKDLQQKSTLASLCADFKQRYPNAKENTDFCNDASSLSNQAVASNYVSINGQSYLINLEKVSEPTYDQFGAQIAVKEPDGSYMTFSLVKDQTVFVNDTPDTKSPNGETMQLVALGTSTSSTPGVGQIYTATIRIPTTALGLDTKVLQQNVPVTITDPSSKQNYILTLENVNLQQYADVSLTPQANNLGSQANFSFNIGIEKRLIQLTPDQIKDKINKTEASIAKLQSIDSFLNTTVNTLSTACVATGAVLTVKNFLANLGGAGIARQIVMTGTGGWNQQCASLVSSGKYSSQQQCFNDNSKQIDSDVNQVTQIINNQNTKIQNLEKPYTTAPSSLLGGTSTVDTAKFMGAYIPVVSTALGKIGSTITNPQNPSQSISVSAAQSLLTNPECGSSVGVTDAKNIELYSNILSSNTGDSSLTTLAQQGLYSTLSGIQANAQSCQKQQTLAQQLNIPSSNVIIGSFQKINTVSITNPQKFGGSPLASSGIVQNGVTSKNNINPQDNYFVFQDQSSGQTYLIDYNADGVVQGTYTMTSATNGYTLSPVTNQAGVAQKNPLNIGVKIYSAGTYQNQYKNPQVQYFETAPYPGMPAIVPFDLKNGWYAAIQQNIASSSLLGGTGATATQSYTASGQVQSFYLCNVGANGIEEFGSSTNDDTCEGINLATNQPYNQFPGLDSAQATQLVNEAESAIQQAAKQHQTGVTSVVINGQNIPVGQPASSSPAIQCTDFMSPSDCNILFNLCDPVVCPPSRCDFGGAYHVQDVVQSGVIGSLLLCLPNAREGILVPVCVTGVKAGLDNWISIQQAYVNCLQDQLNSGQTTGICDEISSIYACNFFWQQAAPLANLAVPTVTSAILGQTTPQGGGEYLNVQNAWNTAKQSVNYLTNYYAASSSTAFKGLTTQGIGTAVCQNFVSSTTPNGANLLSQLANPDSPPQFTGTFQEIPYTTATVPATSQYQVYYHIYAGQNAGVYYSVYLQRSGTGSSYYQGVSTTQNIDAGYIAAGNFTDQTKDLTAPSGYNQLCINVNGQVDCGFQQVSSSFAANYLQNQYVAGQANNTQITTESECVSGTPNVYSLLNPNLQNGATNTINPQIYNQGIIRVCATQNPGIGTDPNAGAQNSRWVQVGTCGSQNMKCWLDTQSVSSVLTSPDVTAYATNGATTTLGNETLQNVENNYMTILQGSGYLSNAQFDSDVSTINSQQPGDKISTINGIINKVFYNNQKAYLYFLRGNAYASLARATAISTQPAGQISHQLAGQEGATTSGTTGPASGTSVGTNGAATASTISANDVLNAMNYAKINGGSSSTTLPVCNCGTPAQCQSYANSIEDSAGKYNEDPLLLLSIMIQESNCEQTNPATGQITQNGNSYGVMQIDSGSVSDCSSIDSNPNNIYSNLNNENIQCGAYILHEKYSLYGGGQSYAFPSSGTCSDGYTAAYSGWDAAVRGYNGFGCPAGTNSHYVENVDNIYNILKNAISPQSTGSAASSSNSNTVSSDEISMFNSFKSYFDTYSQQNVPSSVLIPSSIVTTPRYWTSQDFEALLVAIAEKYNWGGSNGNLLMGYNVGNSAYQSPDTQVKAASVVLSSALEGNSGAPYNSCKAGDVKCILSVYSTGKTDSSGYFIIGPLFGAGANTQGINYANSVLSLWSKWDNYFNSAGSSISSTNTQTTTQYLQP